MFDKIEGVSIISGTVIGFAQIQTILGVIILSFQLILIIYRCARTIYNKIKEKKYDEVDDVLEDTVAELQGLERGDKKDE